MPDWISILDDAEATIELTVEEFDRIAREQGYVKLLDVPIALCVRHGSWAHYFDTDECWTVQQGLGDRNSCEIVRGWPEIAQVLLDREA